MKSQAGPISQRDSVPASSNAVEEIETLVMAKKPDKKAQQVRSSNPIAVAVRKSEQSPEQQELEPEKMMMAGKGTAAKDPAAAGSALKISPSEPSAPPKEDAKGKKLELSPIFKDSQLASSRDGRDTERDNLLLQRIGL